MPQACLPTSTSENHHGRRHQGGGAHIGACVFLHLTRPGPLCCEPGIAVMPMRRVGWDRDVLPGMNAGASLSAVPSPIEGSGTAWVLLGSWALSPARPTPIPPRHECRGFSALLGERARKRMKTL